MNQSEILAKLPYSKPFLFVDALVSISEDGMEGVYTFKPSEFYYEGHFKDRPVTPGVILTECMAQIGVVCLGIFLLKNEPIEELQIALSSHQIDFYKPVFPKEKMTVVSEKVYFRFQKLKCSVKMLNEQNELVAKGTISGMINHTLH
ncbi:MAG TPA: hydroxymyristoyl-ACP dehydratase [Flavobacteriaceae bacterium]|nr:hydroxymyristoyl-ACP dehydratase [Flavobacteriaceae bacterium]MAY52017.1 hydroxymyristoyl-ACP dehydratase [Flavobacteriaceae bacterium]HBR55384.1 hydroxymyristoyl-ACP dehydratase [Flavobacteriaceae bacterium]|tara:strand:+ start:293 stop:733 length:441 start_codon:yes stop_codon:yes gene_type:complete